LAHEDAPRCGAAGQIDGINVLSSVAGVALREALFADVVHGLVEYGGSAGGGSYRGARAAAAVASHQVDGIGFAHIQGRRVDAADRAAVDERNLGGLAAHRQSCVLGGVGEAKLQGQVLDPITGVVDMDFIESVGVEHIEVRAALRILERDVVGQDGDEVLAARFIAAEHVQVGAVDLGHAGDVGTFAVAGREADARRAGGGDGEDCQTDLFEAHGVLLEW